MKNRIVVTGLAIVMGMGLVLTGCGSSSSGSYKNAATESAYYDGDYAAAEMAMEEPADYDYDSRSEGAEEVTDTSRKLITTVNLDTETEDLEKSVALVENKVKALGGYIESSNIYNGTSYSGKSSRSASITARIPAANLDAFIDTVETGTNITRKTVNVDDVTLSYVDTESRKNSLRTEEKRLLDIMESAETVEDLITIEDKLADVRYELESIESQLRSYDNKIDYSTVYMSIDEVVAFTPVEKEGAFTRMGKGFMESVSSVCEFFVELCVVIVSNIPWLIVLGIIALIIVLIVKAATKGSAKKREKKMAMMQAQYQAANLNQQPMNQQPMNQRPVNQQPMNPQPVNQQPAVTDSTPEKGKDGNK